MGLVGGRVAGQVSAPLSPPPLPLLLRAAEQRGSDSIQVIRDPRHCLVRCPLLDRVVLAQCPSPLSSIPHPKSTLLPPRLAADLACTGLLLRASSLPANLIFALRLTASSSIVVAPQARPGHSPSYLSTLLLLSRAPCRGGAGRLLPAIPLLPRLGSLTLHPRGGGKKLSFSCLLMQGKLSVCVCVCWSSSQGRFRELSISQPRRAAPRRAVYAGLCRATPASQPAELLG